VDFAPRPEGVGPYDVPAVIVRLVQVEGGAGRVVVDAYDALTEPFDGGVAAVDVSGRRLGYVGGAAQDVPDGGVVAWLLVPALDSADLDARVAALDGVDPERWLDETLAEAGAWAASRAQVDVDDPWLTDWIDGLDVMLRAQTSPLGGVTPMSRYTSVWLRDSLAPVRWLGQVGRHDEARAAAEYLVACHARRGDIGNACDSGLLPDEIPPEPDWGALPPMSGRTAAEGPSHLPLTFGEVARWTGDHGQIDARWAYLRRSVLGQTVSDDGLQAWSGDETFRLVMNVALGWPLEVLWEDIAWSSNSSYLMLAATDRMAREARRRGEDDAVWTELHERVRAGLDAFLQPEGHWAAVLLRDPEAEPVTAPFEDANLMALWSGGLSPDDPQAIANLASLLRVAGRADGSIQSPPADRYAAMGSDLAGGVATGMAPGYALDNLLQAGHASVDLAFGQLLAYASPSGQYDEGVLYADRSAFSPVYDRGGTLGDVSARYRPWEGAINGAAGWRYLVGDGPDDDGVLHLAPRVPNGLDRVEVDGLRVGEVTVDVERRWADGWEVRVRTSAPIDVQVSVPLPPGDDADGAISLPMGELRVVFPAERVTGERTWRVD
ncbi:MAG TPA: hypothetical protein PKA64_05230, partial [Myxococcota bacterium]|nr:hypothetical protein [Myxococcota bacterium]